VLLHDLGARCVITEHHLPEWRKIGVRGMVIHVQSVEEAVLVLAEVAESGGVWP